MAIHFLTSDRFSARCATFRKQFTKAISTVRFLVATSEPLSSEWNLTMSAGKTFAMPWIVLVSNATSCNHLRKGKYCFFYEKEFRKLTHVSAFHASCCELVLVATSAINVLFTRNERLSAYWRLTDATAEALFVPLSCFVFHLFRA